MQKVDIQFLNQGFHRVLFDAVPIPVFVVDEDIHILEYNAAAARLVGEHPQVVIRRRGGEVLHCIHARETAAGCGGALACRDCVVRQSVQTAWRGWRVSRRWGEMILGQQTQAGQSAFARELPAVHLRKRLLYSADPRRFGLKGRAGIVAGENAAARFRQFQTVWLENNSRTASR